MIALDGVSHFFTDTYWPLRVYPYAAGRPWKQAYELDIPLSNPGFAFSQHPPRIAAAEYCCDVRDGLVWELTAQGAVPRTPFEIKVGSIGRGDGLAADLTGDGQEELILLGTGGYELQVILTSDDGALTGLDPYEAEVQVSDENPLAADFDGDGHMDVSFRSLAPRAIAWGDGEGGFTAAMSVPDVEWRGTTQDLDGDGAAELITVGLGRIIVTEFDGREPRSSTELAPEIPPFGDFYVLDLQGGVVAGSPGVVALGYEAKGDGSNDKLHLSWLAQWQDEEFGHISTTTFEITGCPQQTQALELLPVSDIDGDGEGDIAIAFTSGCESDGQTDLLLSRPMAPGA